MEIKTHILTDEGRAEHREALMAFAEKNAKTARGGRVGVRSRRRMVGAGAAAALVMATSAVAAVYVDQDRVVETPFGGYYYPAELDQGANGVCHGFVDTNRAFAKAGVSADPRASGADIQPEVSVWYFGDATRKDARNAVASFASGVTCETAKEAKAAIADDIANYTSNFGTPQGEGPRIGDGRGIGVPDWKSTRNYWADSDGSQLGALTIEDVKVSVEVTGMVTADSTLANMGELVAAAAGVALSEVGSALGSELSSEPPETD